MPPRGPLHRVSARHRLLPAPNRSEVPLAGACHGVGLVPSAWFLTTSTACSDVDGVDVVAVHSRSWGSPHFGWRTACTTGPKPADQRDRIVPAMRHDPSKMLPARSTPGAHDVRRSEPLHTPSLPPRRRPMWPPCPSRLARTPTLSPRGFVHSGLDLGVLLRSRVCCRRPPLPTTSSAVLPWASSTSHSPYLPARPPDDVVAGGLAAPERADKRMVITSKNCTKVRSPR
jgi:hypothetical protein